MTQHPAARYRQVELESQVAGASPHRLIQLLMAGGLAQLAVAEGATARGDVQVRAQAVGRALDILSGLRDALDLELDHPLPRNLDSLYGYMQYRLLQASLHRDPAQVAEVSRLLGTVKAGWDGIADQVG